MTTTCALSFICLRMEIDINPLLASHSIIFPPFFLLDFLRVHFCKILYFLFTLSPTQLIYLANFFSFLLSHFFIIRISLYNLLFYFFVFSFLFFFSLFGFFFYPNFVYPKKNDHFMSLTLCIISIYTSVFTSLFSSVQSTGVGK